MWGALLAVPTASIIQSCFKYYRHEIEGIPDLGGAPLDLGRDVFMGHEISAEVLEAASATASEAASRASPRQQAWRNPEPATP